MSTTNPRTQPNAVDAFDRRGGNGSASDADTFLDEQSIYDNEWGSAAATTFNPADTDAHDNSLPQVTKQKFQRLYAHHNGKGESNRRQDIITSHMMNDTDTFVSVLDMPAPQRRRVKKVIEELDTSSNNFGGRKYEKIILAVCSLVSDEAVSRRHSVESNIDITEQQIGKTDAFNELMEATGMSATEYRTIREQVRQRSEYF